MSHTPKFAIGDHVLWDTGVGTKDALVLHVYENGDLGLQFPEGESIMVRESGRHILRTNEARVRAWAVCHASENEVMGVES